MPEYNLTATGPICRNRPECRGRQLSQSYEARGLKRWARQTAEHLLRLMDVPPKGWDPEKVWESADESRCSRPSNSSLSAGLSALSSRCKWTKTANRLK